MASPLRTREVLDEDADDLAALVGAAYAGDPDCVEPKRLHLDARLRDQGLATRLARSIEARAPGRGATRTAETRQVHETHPTPPRTACDPGSPPSRGRG